MFANKSWNKTNEVLVSRQKKNEYYDFTKSELPSTSTDSPLLQGYVKDVE